MKVICAGMPKTGTKTLKSALETLGYNVYDYMENFDHLGDDWMKIFAKGGTTEDFRRMFENIDAVTDAPCYYYWEEIHKAFPEAKIIFTQRENEDIWFNSFERQIKHYPPVMFAGFHKVISPTYGKFWNYSELLMTTTYGSIPQNFLIGGVQINELQLRMQYRKHNSHVLQNAPKDKLLVFNFKDGWGPLCEFLNVDIPDELFPHRNVKGEIMGILMKTEPTLLRLQKEIFIFYLIVSVMFGLIGYKLIKSGGFDFN